MEIARHRGEVHNVGADQEGARVITTQSKAEENHYKLHHRFTRANKSGQHVLHELHRSGSDTHTTATRLLSLRQTQVRDAIKLLSGV